MHVWREKKELESIAGLSCTDRSSHTQPEEREVGSKLPSLKDEQREETLEATYLLSRMEAPLPCMARGEKSLVGTSLCPCMGVS